MQQGDSRLHFQWGIQQRTLRSQLLRTTNTTLRKHFLLFLIQARHIQSARVMIEHWGSSPNSIHPQPCTTSIARHNQDPRIVMTMRLLRLLTMVPLPYGGVTATVASLTMKLLILMVRQTISQFKVLFQMKLLLRLCVVTDQSLRGAARFTGETPLAKILPALILTASEITRPSSLSIQQIMHSVQY